MALRFLADQLCLELNCPNLTRSLGRSPAPLLTVLLKTLFFALFFAPFNVDIHIVRVAPFLLKLASLLPETPFIEAFAASQVLGETGIHVAANLFDLDYGALQRLLIGK